MPPAIPHHATIGHVVFALNATGAMMAIDSTHAPSLAAAILPRPSRNSTNLKRSCARSNGIHGNIARHAFEATPEAVNATAHVTPESTRPRSSEAANPDLDMLRLTSSGSRADIT